MVEYEELLKPNQVESLLHLREWAWQLARTYPEVLSYEIARERRVNEYCSYSVQKPDYPSLVSVSNVTPQDKGEGTVPKNSKNSTIFHKNPVPSHRFQQRVELQVVTTCSNVQNVQQIGEQVPKVRKPVESTSTGTAYIQEMRESTKSKESTNLVKHHQALIKENVYSNIISVP